MELFERQYGTTTRDSHYNFRPQQTDCKLIYQDRYGHTASLQTLYIWRVDGVTTEAPYAVPIHTEDPYAVPVHTETVP